VLLSHGTWVTEARLTDALGDERGPVLVHVGEPEVSDDVLQGDGCQRVEAARDGAVHTQDDTSLLSNCFLSYIVQHSKAFRVWRY